MALKAVIFGVDGILTKKQSSDKSGLAGPKSDEIVTELKHLFAFLRARNVRPIVVTNREWVVRDAKTGTATPIDEPLRKAFGNLRLYVASRGDIPYKPQRQAFEAVLNCEGLRKEEVVVLGVSQEDFRSSINAGLLFLNATWDREEVDYGFKFKSPEEVERFIDLFALKEHHWFYRIDTPIRLRSLAPFSTYKDLYRVYSEAARRAAKEGTPERHFFLNTVVALLYFTGEIAQLDYIACAPRHEEGYGNPQMDDVLRLTGNIFRKRYLPDLIVRHTTVPSNRAERNAGRTPTLLVHLNSIQLTRRPLKTATERYKSPIKLAGKHIAVFDDFATVGTTFEAARLYLERAGAQVTLVSWLKTINSDYQATRIEKKFDPFSRNTFTNKDVKTSTLPYSRYIVDPSAAPELDAALARFRQYGRQPTGGQR